MIAVVGHQSRYRVCAVGRLITRAFCCYAKWTDELHAIMQPRTLHVVHVLSRKVCALPIGSSAAENTLNTLRYAQRVKDFSNKRPAAAVAMRRLASAPNAPEQAPLPGAPPSSQPTATVQPTHSPLQPTLQQPTPIGVGSEEGGGRSNESQSHSNHIAIT